MSTLSEPDVAPSSSLDAARLGALIATLPGGVLVEDEQRRIVLVNEELCAVFGLPVTPAELVGCDCSRSAEQSKHLAAEPEEFVARIGELLDGRPTIRGETVRFADGRIFERDFVPIQLGDADRGQLWHYRDVSATHRRADELATARQHFFDALDQSPVGGILTDASGSCTAVNKRWCELSGMSGREALGAGWTRALHPDDRERIVAAWDEAVRKAETFHAEYRFLRPDGDVRWLIGRSVPLRDAGGDVTGHMRTVEDVTAQRHAEETRRAQERAAHAILEIAADGSQSFDERLASVLEEGCALLGLPQGKIGRFVGEDLEISAAHDPLGDLQPGDIVPVAQTLCGVTAGYDTALSVPDLAASVWGDHPACRLHGMGAYVGVPIIASGERYGALSFWGPDRQVRDFGQGERDLVSLMAQWIGAAIDRARAEDALRASEARAAATIRTARDSIVTVDDRGCIVDLNPAAERCFRVGREDALGRQAVDLFLPEELRGGWRENLAAFAHTGHYDGLGEGTEIVCQRADGERFPADLVVSPVPDTGPPLLNAYLRDLSERKAFERDLASARDQALEAARAKSEFLAVMSHEIRTPMNGVFATVDLLQGTSLSVEQRELTDVLHHSSQALLGIIDDILDFSKIEAGGLDLVHEPFDLAGVIEGAADVFAADASSRGLTLSTVIDPKIDQTLIGDGGRLRQVILNVLGNAIKFTDEGEISISVSPRGLSDQEAELVIRVTDTGPGIPPELAPRLFDPFTQGDASSTRRHGGTGLGLVICQRLVALMDGAIGVEETSPAGTTMAATVRLRRTTTPCDARPSVALDALSVVLAVPPSRAATALATYLEACGARVERRDGLPTALDAPDLLVVNAPGGSGVPAAALAMGVPTIVVTQRSVPHPLPAHARALPSPVHRRRLVELAAELTGRATTPAIDDRVADSTPGPTTLSSSAPVLIAEDDPTNRALALRQLARLGVPARAVRNGREAVEVAASGDYSMILMDCRMPEMDGYDATVAIRRSEDGTTRRLPIVALTADVLPRERKACLDAGMDDFLAKPMSLEGLRDTLLRWLAPPVTADTPATSVARQMKQLAEDVGGVDGAIAIAEIWRDSVPELLTTLEECASRDDIEGAASVGHRVVSNASALGATDLARDARSLENAARAGGDISELAGTVAAEIRDLDTALRDWLATTAAS